MKAIIEFNLDDHYERCSHNVMLQAHKLLRVINEVDDEMRTRMKYKDEKYIRIENVRKIIADKMDELGVHIEEE